MYHFVVVFLAIFAYYWFYLRTPGVPQLTEHVNATYDYIVVGAGSAGAVVASRLSEDAGVTVLLVEAGGYDLGNPAVDVPALVAGTFFSHMDWGFWTVPQKNAHLSLKEQRSYVPRGRTLGGSSVLNYMIYMRGGRQDYDEWAARGATGWSYDDVLPYFLKSEDVQVDSLKKSKYHSTGGVLKVSITKNTPLTEIFFKAGQELGYKLHDCNGDDGNPEGLCETTSTIGNGVRSSTAHAFLQPAFGRRNLHVAVNAHVTKILMENKKATGIEFSRNDKLRRVYVRKEVILSAGSIGSPQILMLSGIGPKTHLEELKIPVVADLPVGNNLQDHVYLNLPVDIDKQYSVTPGKLHSLWTKLEYAIFKTGYKSSAQQEGTLFLSTSKDGKGGPDAMLQISVTQWRYWANHSLTSQLEAKALNEVHPLPSQSDRPKEGFTVSIVAPIRPLSTGSIRLKSRDPFDHPLIDPRYFEHPDDVKALVRAVRHLQKVLNTAPFKEIGARLWDSDKSFSKCYSHGYDTDAYWECQIRHLATSGFHLCCTAKIGHAEDGSTVVDPQLRVKGISGLRVVDASIMPSITTGNTNAPTIMIAEKAADMIRGIISVDDLSRKKR